MKIAIMQPYFLPYIGYWQLINAVDKFIIYDDVNYIKGGWINRNRILINGNPSYITVHLKNASSNNKIYELLIDESRNWRKKIFKTIVQYYKKAPYYEESISVIEKILYYESQMLIDFVRNSILQICKYLNIKTEIVNTSKIYENDDLKGQDRIIDICRKEGADVYINPIGGKELYSKEIFSSEGIKLLFLKSHNITYKQFENIFVPNLSIIDVLMFNSVVAVKDEMFKQYDLI